MQNGTLRIGWASVDITPERPVQLAGQFHIRLSEGVQDPVTATALALSSGPGDDGVVWVSCDLVIPPDSLRNAVRERVAKVLPGLDPQNVILSATHSHTAPELRIPADYRLIGGISAAGGSDVGTGMPLVDAMLAEAGAMSPADCVVFVAERIADAVVRAWGSRAPGSLGYGLGHAVVGRNRRSVYEGGVSRMYGDTSDPAFLHIEGCEDHDVNVLATWGAEDQLTGLVLNVACPSQVSENSFEISADYWHDTRLELRRRLGADLFVLPQCSAAGDQSPHVQIGRAVEERMQRLAGRTQRQEIAVRLADAVAATLPWIEQARDDSPVLRHRVETLALPRRRLSQADVDETQVEAGQQLAEYERLHQELEAQPALREVPRWYQMLTHHYRRANWCKGVAMRFEIEKTEPNLPVEVHVVRLGDVVFATNPFEYYLDFGQRIKARSAAVQTFLVQLAGNGTYVPTERAVAGKSYGAVPASTPVGPEGGRELAEWTVGAIADLFREDESR